MSLYKTQTKNPLYIKFDNKSKTQKNKPPKPNKFSIIKKKYIISDDWKSEFGLGISHLQFHDGPMCPCITFMTTWS